MRYDKKIILIYENKKEYDPIVGGYPAEEPERVEKTANVTNISMQTQNEIFGEIQSEIITARIQGKNESNPAKLIYQDKLYKILQIKINRNDTAFFAQGIV